MFRAPVTDAQEVERNSREKHMHWTYSVTYKKWQFSHSVYLCCFSWSKCTTVHSGQRWHVAICTHGFIFNSQASLSSSGCHDLKKNIHTNKTIRLHAWKSYWLLSKRERGEKKEMHNTVMRKTKEFRSCICSWCHFKRKNIHTLRWRTVIITIVFLFSLGNSNIQIIGK